MALFDRLFRRKPTPTPDLTPDEEAYKEKTWRRIETLVGPTLLIRPDLSMIYAAYFTRVSWKNFRTRSGDFSSVCMCSVVAAFSLALVRTGTFV